MNTRILEAARENSLTRGAIMARTSLAAIAIAAAFPAFAQSASNSASPLPPTALPTNPQDAAEAIEEDQRPDDIVVTGTLIRGTTPAGSTLITTTAKQAEEQGAANGNEILAQIPQAANFFQGLPAIGGFGLTNSTIGTVSVASLPVAQITLRNLPGANTGGSPTLILIDGHRVVPVGTSAVAGQAVDSLSISSATLLRVEVMPDGGSAIYGSDAVAGTINYITKDSFDGVELRARGGIAGSYKQWDGSVTAGTKWSSGSLYGSVGYSYHDPLFGRDREYIRSVDGNPLSPLYRKPLGLNCVAPNIQITSVVNGINSTRLYPLLGGPGGAIQPFTTNGGTNGNGVGTNGLNATSNGIAGGNRCDSTTDWVSYYPKSRTINANFGLKQELTDTLTFGLKGSWSDRRTTAYAPLTLTTSSTTPVGPTNPNYRKVCNAPVVPPAVQPAGPICGVTEGFFAGDDTRTHIISTDFSSVLGPYSNSYNYVTTWQVTPSLAWNFAKDWQLRGLLSYGESKATGIQGGVDTNELNPRITSGLINPYNLPAGGPGAFDGLVTYQAFIGRFHLLDARVVADGPLPFFELPGGPIRAAIGAEYMKTDLILSQTGAVRSRTPDNFLLDQQNPIPGQPQKYTQTVKSVFGELQIPLVGEGTNIPLISALDISASARYDKYNDFGSTFNPMFGATWAVVPWFKIRGNWGTSFAAPNNLTQLAVAPGAQLNNVRTNATNPLAYFNNTQQGGVRQQISPGVFGVLAIQPILTSGTAKDLGPQTSENWSIGFDAQPPFIPGLSFGASYFKLKISNTIGSPGLGLFETNPELIYCAGDLNGRSPNAATACLTPFSTAELTARGFTVAADPLNRASPGLSSLASLTGTGTAGSGSAISWPTILANYCEPSVYTSGAGGGAACAPNTYTVLQVMDNRARNLGFVYASGIDFNVNYVTDVSWGSIDARVSGAISLTGETQASVSAPRINYLESGQTSAFRMTSSLGTNWGGLRAQITWQHSHGYDIPPNGTVGAPTTQGVPGTATVPGTNPYGQTRVGSYDTFDLFFRYRFDHLGERNAFFRGLEATLNINNVFDTSPPDFGNGFANGLTLGRFWQLGLTKAFK
jgi:iron complex outermembrane receptor protein